MFSGKIDSRIFSKKNLILCESQLCKFNASRKIFLPFWFWFFPLYSPHFFRLINWICKIMYFWSRIISQQSWRDIVWETNFDSMKVWSLLLHIYVSMPQFFRFRSQNDTDICVFALFETCLYPQYLDTSLQKIEHVIGTVKQIFECRIAIIFSSISINTCFGCSKEPSHWDGSFEYPQQCFGWEIYFFFEIRTLVWRPAYAFGKQIRCLKMGQ